MKTGRNCRQRCNQWTEVEPLGEKNQYICIYIAPDRIKIILRCFTETQGLTSSGKGNPP